MNFNIFNTLMLVGTIQGIIFGSVIFLSPKYRSKNNFILASLIVGVALNSLQYYLSDIGCFSYGEMMSTYYIPFVTLNITLLYLYIKSFLHTEKPFTQKDKLLFLPFLFFLIITSIYKILLLLDPKNEAIENSYTLFANMHEVFAFFYALILIILSFKNLHFYSRNFLNYNSPIVPQQVFWLKVTLFLLLLLTFIYGYLMVKVILLPQFQINFYVIWISDSFMIYWLGYIGIYNYGIQKERQNIRKYKLDHVKVDCLEKKKNNTINEFERLIIEDKKFLDPQISLETIASELDVSKGHLSRLIKTELNTGFTDFINILRIDEAKNHLSNPEFSNYTLAAIGLEAGFNSKSTFYSTFKKSTGFTPLQFKNNLTNL